jgi:hemolysin activation/secretion protein
MSELEISGPSAVRAYDVAAVSVDQGCFAQSEFVHQQNEQRAFFGFIDLASGKTNHSNFAKLQEGDEKNEFSIFGAGVGTRLNIADKFNLSITYAKRLGVCKGCVQAQAKDRLWAALTVTF